MKKLLVVDLQWQFQDEGAVKYNKCLSFVKENMYTPRQRTRLSLTAVSRL